MAKSTNSSSNQYGCGPYSRNPGCTNSVGTCGPYSGGNPGPVCSTCYGGNGPVCSTCYGGNGPVCSAYAPGSTCVTSYSK